MILRRFFKGQRKRPLPIDAPHEIRNALAGVQLERRKILRGLKMAFEGVLAQQQHMKRIEEALRENARVNGKDQTP